MDFFNTLLGACSSVQKSKQLIREEDASEMQLNAFEFRNYRTSLEPKQQQLLERVVNQWCSMLVKGKTMKINDFEEKIYLDKDMLNLEYSGELFPLKAISRMEMFKDMDDMVMEVPWGLDVTFEFQKGDSNIRFNFAQERHRINFALTLRILRTRDPTLDLNSQTVDVLTKDEEEGDTEDEPPTFNKLVSTQRFNIQLSGIPIVFSVSDLKITSTIRSTSRHVYLEFFVRYPRQDRFLYAKSGTTHIPQQVIAVEDMKRKKKSEKEAEENDEEKKMAAKKKAEEVKCTMKFDLKNVKLKIPKVPHQIFGRLMAKDDYFPTALGTFEFEVKRSFLQDKREADQAQMEERITLQKKLKKKGLPLADGLRTEPETLAIPVISSYKLAEEDAPGQVGVLTIRIIGYVTDEMMPERHKGEPSSLKDTDNAPKSGDDEEMSEDDPFEEEDSEEDDEEEEEDED